MRCLALLVALSAGCDLAPIVATLVEFGGDRPALLVLPPHALELERAPLLVVLHPYGGDGAAVLEYAQIAEEAAKRGVFVIAPDGKRDANGNRFWNGGACCDFDETGPDDRGYINALVSEIAATWSIDGRRVAVLGFDAGAFLAYLLACDAGSPVSHIIAVGGAAPFDSAACDPARSLTATHIHGDADMLVAYGGSAEQPGALFSAATVAGRNGCDPLPIVVERVDIDAEIAGKETRIGRFPFCSSGQVELWTSEGSGHLPPLQRPFAERIIDGITAEP